MHGISKRIIAAGIVLIGLAIAIARPVYAQGYTLNSASLGTNAITMTIPKTGNTQDVSSVVADKNHCDQRLLDRRAHVAAMDDRRSSWQLRRFEPDIDGDGDAREGEVGPLPLPHSRTAHRVFPANVNLPVRISTQ
jgi:hypothetical protein